MKKSPWLLAVLLLVGFSTPLFAQQTQADPPYKRTGTLPAMSLLGLDSATSITLNTLPKDMPLIVICFSTTCDHCQHEAEDLVKNKNKFKKVRIVMIGLESLAVMKAFYDKYKLSELKNLVIGRDTRFFAPSFYIFKRLPFSVLYNKEHKYLSSFESTTPAEKFIEEFKKHKQL